MCENRRRPPMNRGMVPPAATPARPARMCGPDAATIGRRIAGDLELDCNSLPGSIGGRRMRIHSAVGIRPVVCTGIRRASTVRAARARRSGLTWDRVPSGGCPVVDGAARAGPLAVPSRPPCLVGMDVLYHRVQSAPSGASGPPGWRPAVRGRCRSGTKWCHVGRVAVRIQARSEYGHGCGRPVSDGGTPNSRRSVSGLSGDDGVSPASTAPNRRCRECGQHDARNTVNGRTKFLTRCRAVAEKVPRGARARGAGRSLAVVR